MATFEEHLADYEAHHTSPGNKLTHAVGIPLIALALLGLAARVPLVALGEAGRVDLGHLLAAAFVLALMRWHVGLALGFALLLAPLYLVGARISVIWLGSLLAVGLALQYVGHLVFERNQPAFHRNAVHMLVGPLWIAARVFRTLGLYRPAPRTSG